MINQNEVQTNQRQIYIKEAGKIINRRCFLLDFIVWCVSFFKIIFSHQQGSSVDQQIFVVIHCRKILEFIQDLNTVIGNKSGNLSPDMFALSL